MSDSTVDGPENVDWETLERLYDDPDGRVSELQECRPDDDVVVSEYRVFRALANEDRLRLLGALRHGERCGCELRVVLDAPQSTVATHLRKLRDAGLVANRKKGKWTYYRIADTAVLEIVDLAAALYDD